MTNEFAQVSTCLSKDRVILLQTNGRVRELAKEPATTESNIPQARLRQPNVRYQLESGLLCLRGQVDSTI